jgi:histidinol dehydrogenase
MVVAVCVLATPLSAQVDTAWLGEWRLNLARSSYSPGPAPYVRASYRIESHLDGIRVVYEMVRPRGGVTHLEWTGRFDGQDYAVQGVEESVTYAYRQVDARTYEVVTKVDGRVAATSRAVLSADGRSITTTTAGRDGRGEPVATVTVYEKG